MICYDIFIIQYQPTGLLMVKFLLAHVCLEHYFQIVCGNIRIIDIDFQSCRFPSTNAFANKTLSPFLNRSSWTKPKRTSLLYICFDRLILTCKAVGSMKQAFLVWKNGCILRSDSCEFFLCKGHRRLENCLSFLHFQCVERPIVDCLERDGLTQSLRNPAITIIHQKFSFLRHFSQITSSASLLAFMLQKLVSRNGKFFPQGTHFLPCGTNWASVTHSHNF